MLPVFCRPLLGHVVTKSIFGTAGYDVSVAGCAFYLFNVLSFLSQKCKFSVVSVYWCYGAV